MSQIFIDDTRFIFDTNFAGDPSKDRFRDDRRKCNIVIPTKEQADKLMNMGVNVKVTKQNPEYDKDGWEPTYYICAICNFSSQWPPKVYLVKDGCAPVQLNEDTVGCLDDIWVKNVNCVLNTWERQDGVSVFVKTLYVEQREDDDPYRERYSVACPE